MCHGSGFNRSAVWPQVWDPERVVIIPDHYIFTSDPRANRNVDILRCPRNFACFVNCISLLESLECSFGRALCAGCGIALNLPGFAKPDRGLMPRRDMVKQYGIKYFYDITDRSDFKANPDYKGVCHIALAQEGHCKPGARPRHAGCLLLFFTSLFAYNEFSLHCVLLSDTLLGVMWSLLVMQKQKAFASLLLFLAREWSGTRCVLQPMNVGFCWLVLTLGEP